MAPVSGRPPELTEFRHLCFHSHRYFIVPLRDTRLLTSKELRYNLLTFTIFIIQSQVGAIPVFSRLFHMQFASIRVLFFSLTVVVLFNRLHRVYAVWFQISDFAFYNECTFFN